MSGTNKEMNVPSCNITYSAYYSAESISVTGVGSSDKVTLINYSN